MVSALGLLIVSLLSNVICALCGPLYAIAGGAAAGWLSQRWGTPEKDSPPAVQGAIAGGIAGLGTLVGQIGAAAFNVWLVSSGAVPEIEELLGVPLGQTELAAGVIVWSCVGLVGVALAAGAGMLSARLAAPQPDIEQLI
ncbi:MAG: hypothetical protein Kow00124_04800 [Anaerolineae bacterium]